MPPIPLELTVRVGCHLVYEAARPTPILFVLRPRRDGRQVVIEERFLFDPPLYHDDYDDAHGNPTCRCVLQPGQNIVHHDALVAVSSLPDHHDPLAFPCLINELPPEVVRYTLPSRYCDSDKLMNFAWQHFGHTLPGPLRVQAICDWVHSNIQYRFGGGRADTAASEIIAQGYGVCRDFAHTAIALCRAFNLPARYVVGHLPDIGFRDPGTSMDFHAYFEVYLGNGWYTYDARFNIPRIGRIKVAQGLDAVDGAFSTIYGEARLAWFEVWAYQINPRRTTLDDPVDLSQRLDGTPRVRLH